MLQPHVCFNVLRCTHDCPRRMHVMHGQLTLTVRSSLHDAMWLPLALKATPHTVDPWPTPPALLPANNTQRWATSQPCVIHRTSATNACPSLFKTSFPFLFPHQQHQPQTIAN